MISVKRFKPVKFNLKPILLVLCSYYLLNLISLFWSFNIANAILASQRIFLGIAFFYILQLKILNQKSLLTFIQVIFSISLCYLIFELVNLNSFNQDEFYKIHNLFIHKNLFASFLFLGLIFSLYSIFKLKNTWKAISIINSLGIISSLVILQNRTVLIASFLGLGLYIFKYSKRVRLILSGIFIVVSISLLVGISMDKTKQINELEALSLDSIEERVKLWGKTISLIKENPILGIGAGNWQYNYAKFSVNDVYMIHQNKTNFQKPHNDYLWVLSETGTLGFILILAALFLLFKQAKIGQSKEVNILWAGLFGYGIISFFSFPSERIIHLFLFIILISFLLDPKSTKTRFNDSTAYLKPVFLFGLAFNIFLGINQLYGEYHTRKLLEAQMVFDYSKMVEHGEASLSTFYKTDPTSTPIASYLGFAYHKLGNQIKAFNYAEEAYNLAPYDFQVLSNYGSQLMQSGDYVKAKEILNEAYRINKYNDEIKINLVILNYNQHNYWQAFQWIQEIPVYKQNQPELLHKIIQKLSFN